MLDGEGTTTSYAYNTSTRRITRTDNLDGTNYYTYYDLNTNKTVGSIIYADSTTSTFTYDKMRRPRTVTVQNGGTSSSLTVNMDSMGNPRSVSATREDSTVDQTTYAYNNDISLNYVQEPDGKQLVLGYDRLMRTTSITKSTGGSQTTAQSYSYNNADQLTQTQLSSYAVVSYGYNKDGQLRFIKRGNYTVTIYTYAADGRLSGIAHMKDPSNNTTYATSTDTVSNNGDDLNITVLSYTYNNDSAITARTRSIYNPPGTLSRTISMSAGYDELGRIMSETYNGGGLITMTKRVM